MPKTMNIMGIGSQILPQTGHLAGLNQEWEEVLNHANKLVYAKNTVIPHEQAGIYYLSRGLVNIFYSSSCGRERLALCIGAGCIFNEARAVSGLYSEGRFVCMEESEVWRFPETLLEDPNFIRDHPRQVISLLRSMSIKILTHYTFLAEMGTGPHTAHLCRFILALARKHNSDSFACGMTQQKVADLLGIHRTTLVRVLQQLKRAGIVSAFTAHRIQVDDWERLTELAEQ